MKRWLMLLTLLLSLCMVGLVSAQDGDENPRENACFTGGEWEGKCDWPTEDETKWAWACGYYYAQNPLTAPGWCKFMVITPPPEALRLCIGSDGIYILLLDGPNQPDNAQIFYDLKRSTSPCDTLTAEPTPMIWMQAETMPDVLELINLCTEADPDHVWNIADAIEDPSLTGFNWVCSAL